MHMISLPCADISNYSREDKDMLRGAGLMSQASGLGPASARTTTGAPAKVRLCSRRSCFCPLLNPAFIAAQVHSLCLSSYAQESELLVVLCNPYNLACAEWQQCG